MEAIGSNGRMTIDGDRLVISRKGTGLLTAINLGLQGDKVIPIAQITAVELRPPNAFTYGYFRLSINGRDPIGGVAEAIKDENTVLVLKPHLAAFTALRDELLKRMSKPAAATGASTADEIEKLAALRDRGVLTEEEFTARKRQLLSL